MRVATFGVVLCKVSLGDCHSLKLPCRTHDSASSQRWLNEVGTSEHTHRGYILSRRTLQLRHKSFAFRRRTSFAKWTDLVNLTRVVRERKINLSACCRSSRIKGMGGVDELMYRDNYRTANAGQGQAKDDQAEQHKRRIDEC